MNEKIGAQTRLDVILFGQTTLVMMTEFVIRQKNEYRSRIN